MVLSETEKGEDFNVMILVARHVRTRHFNNTRMLSLTRAKVVCYFLRGSGKVTSSVDRNSLENISFKMKFLNYFSCL